MIPDELVTALNLAFPQPILMQFDFSTAVSYAVAPMMSGLFLAFVLSALDIFLPYRGALDKRN